MELFMMESGLMISKMVKVQKYRITDIQSIQVYLLMVKKLVKVFVNSKVTHIKEILLTDYLKEMENIALLSREKYM
jgi:hypothetical protein